MTLINTDIKVYRHIRTCRVCKPQANDGHAHRVTGHRGEGEGEGEGECEREKKTKHKQ